MNLGNEINTITSTYTAKLSLTIQKTNVGTQKINSFTLVTYKIVIARLFVQNRLEKVQFFEKTFLLVETSMEVVLKIHFLTFSDVNIWFVDKQLKWRRYSIAKALSTI